MSLNIYFSPDEKPLDNIVEGYSFTSIFRTIGFIGDSLSSGEFETVNSDGTRSYHDCFEYSWGQFIARKNSLKAYNFSRGGMTAKWYMESYADENGFWDKDKACQAYVIALGVNEIICQNNEVGSTDDIDKGNYRNNKDTYIGHYAAIVSRYKEISPDAKFFFVTMCRPEENDPNDEKIKKANSALKALCEIFENSYLIDLYTYGPTYDKKFAEYYYLLGHMSPAGYLLTAKMVDSYIDYIVRTNYNDFKEVGFIARHNI